MGDGGVFQGVGNALEPNVVMAVQSMSLLNIIELFACRMQVL